jgi:hypothetical protein
VPVVESWTFRNHPVLTGRAWTAARPNKQKGLPRRSSPFTIRAKSNPLPEIYSLWVIGLPPALSGTFFSSFFAPSAFPFFVGFAMIFFLRKFVFLTSG